MPLLGQQINIHTHRMECLHAVWSVGTAIHERIRRSEWVDIKFFIEYYLFLSVTAVVMTRQSIKIPVARNKSKQSLH